MGQRCCGSRERLENEGGMVYNPLWNDRGEKAAAVLRDALIRRDPGSMELALQELVNARSLKLDLQSRRLGDTGASKLAEALRATRSLEELELNLGGNSISKKRCRSAGYRTGAAQVTPKVTAEPLGEQLG
ncbi:unnamed protein product [Symbiodinium sp. CCMP2592]|nr:unnamed protein product [Symbiodinium sp. CCMP2592]